MSTTPDSNEAEERCLDADVWADELDAWAAARPEQAACEEAQAMARMLRAMAKSIRLALFADSGDEAAVLVEELTNLVREAQALAMGARPQPLEDVVDGEVPRLLASEKAGKGLPETVQPAAPSPSVVSNLGTAGLPAAAGAPSAGLRGWGAPRQPSPPPSIDSDDQDPDSELPAIRVRRG